MKIFFSVGEPSGDLHGANLIRRMKQRLPDIETVGYGGPRMAAVGCELHEDLTQLALMWLGRVLLNLHKFWNLAGRADRYFRHQRPDAVVLIDYPGFNWWIARRAKAHGIPVFYYGTPQMWAWAGWRVKKMRRLVDHVLCKLPFEPAWYRQRGCDATFVGHPYFDQLADEQLDQRFLDQLARQPGHLVTILPGSRTQEVKNNLRWLLKAAQRVHERVPSVRFAIASFKPSQGNLAERQAATCNFPVDVFVGRTPELIQASRCTMACSGSVSLELLYHERPTVIHYWISRPFYYFVKLFGPLLQLKVKYITLVNMLADEPLTDRPRSLDTNEQIASDIPFPEFVTCGDQSAELARFVTRWLTDEMEYQRRRDQLRHLRKQVAHGGASERAAEYILAQLGATKPPIPAPHFLGRHPTASVTESAVARDAVDR